MFVGAQRYKYDSAGSTVTFTPTQLDNFLNFLRDALADEELELFDAGEAEQVQGTIDYVLAQISQQAD